MKKKIISFLLLISLTTVLLTACKKEEPQYTITYMLDNDTEFASETGTIINQKPLPSKKGFHFVNWYNNPSFESNPIVFPFTIKKDFKAYALFEEGIYETYKYSDSDNCSITKLYYCPLDDDIIFPDKINGINVKNINTSIAQNNYIKSIAFEKDIYIKRLQITIENLEKVDLSNLSSLENITISSCQKLKTLILPNVTEIKSNFLMFDQSLTEINLPNTLELISKNAFNGLFNLKTITIPTSIKKINTDAFNGCINLEKIIINNDSIVDLGAVEGKISNSDNTIIYVKENLLEEYKSKYTKMNFAKII